MAPIYRTMKSHDGHVELQEIQATCKKHEHLCRQYAECSKELQQNDAQLEILGETANFLKEKHEELKKIMQERPHSEKEMLILEDQMNRVENQVVIWMKELEEINDNRLQIEIRFLQLSNELKKSVTCVQLASIDFELIQMRHKERWRKFLSDHVPTSNLVPKSQS